MNQEAVIADCWSESWRDCSLGLSRGIFYWEIEIWVALIQLLGVVCLGEGEDIKTRHFGRLRKVGPSLLNLTLWSCLGYASIFRITRKSKLFLWSLAHRSLGPSSKKEETGLFLLRHVAFVGEVKSIDHIFLHCPFAANGWSDILEAAFVFYYCLPKHFWWLVINWITLFILSATIPPFANPVTQHYDRTRSAYLGSLCFL